MFAAYLDHGVVSPEAAARVLNRAPSGDQTLEAQASSVIDPTLNANSPTLRLQREEAQEQAAEHQALVDAVERALTTKSENETSEQQQSLYGDAPNFAALSAIIRENYSERTRGHSGTDLSNLPRVAFPANAINRIKMAVAYFQSQGWTKAQAIGIVANLWQESKLDPNAVGDGGRAHGLAQWHPDRLRALETALGKPYSKWGFMDHLRAVDYELQHGGEQRAGRLLRAETTSTGAAAVVSRHYERPGNSYAQQRQRAGIARGFEPHLA